MSAYSSWFRSATGADPYAWQLALAAPDACGDRLIRIPTGFGKTLGVLAAWLHHRVVRGDERWPRRLVWTLPMRVLVEQTESEVRQCLGALGLLWEEGKSHAGKVGVHALMGGAESGEWHLFPEACAVLIGTQDMLLSRAMNRGYGAARARWPTDFGLISQDVLWVLDEVQLMDVGLATAAQLGAFRKQDAGRAGSRPAFTWAMSATLQRDWVEQSPDTPDWVAGLTDASLGDEDREAPLWTSTSKPLERVDALPAKALASMVFERHLALGNPHALTLVVANTVDRAKELWAELDKRVAGKGIDLHVLHSRFRGHERASWKKELLGKDAPPRPRIIVATQVIEAGVDISADLLFTELCPWPSLVQRLGRLARRGGTGHAVIVGLDTEKSPAPYDKDDLTAAWAAVDSVPDGSPRGLEAFEKANPALLPGLYPYEPAWFLLREEIDELFDTTPDLSGSDLDISRYIRTGDERDVSVFWIAAGPAVPGEIWVPDAKLRATRAGLCAVPFLKARNWLCGEKKGDIEPKRLRPGMEAWVWDYLDGSWRKAERKDLWPGQTVLVAAACGGYDLRAGWEPASKALVPVVGVVEATLQEQTDSAQDHEDLSEAPWQTIGFHGGAAAREMARMTDGLVSDPGLRRLLHLTARWHDLGKSHPAFQASIESAARPARADLAKAPSAAWKPPRKMYEYVDGDGRKEKRRGFRHELASVLGLFAVLGRHAPPEHPSRLGALTALVPGTGATSVAPPSALEAEILALGQADFDLLAYLVCSHHGKVRARLHAGAEDQASLQHGEMPLRGIRAGDKLPSVDLEDAAGVRHRLPESELSLEPASLGLSEVTGRSWTERVEGVRQAHGPFALAWLEALLRAADVRASKDTALVDPTLRHAEGA